MQQKLQTELVRPPKTLTGRRILESKKPKFTENDKKTMLVGTATASRMTQEFMRDLAQLKRPLMQRLHTPVENPFNGKQQLESLSQKTDCSLFVHISHTKKRPNNVVFGRLFDG